MKRRFAPCCCTKLERMFKKPNDMDQWTSAFALRLKKVFVPAVDICGLLIFAVPMIGQALSGVFKKSPPRFPILSFCLKRCRWCRGLLAGCLFAERLWFLCFCEHDAGFECAVLCTGLFLGCLRVACKLLMVSTFAKQLRVMTKCIHAVRQLVCDVAQVIGSCPQ